YLSSDANGKWSKHEYDDKGREWRSKSFVDQDGNDTAYTLTDLDAYDGTDRPYWKLDSNQYELIKDSSYSIIRNQMPVTVLLKDMTPEEVDQTLIDSELARLTRHIYDEFGRVTRTDLPSAGAAPAFTESRYDDAG